MPCSEADAGRLSGDLATEQEQIKTIPAQAMKAQIPCGL
jgi:hypothetical protein